MRRFSTTCIPQALAAAMLIAGLAACGGTESSDTSYERGATQGSTSASGWTTAATESDDSYVDSFVNSTDSGSGSSAWGSSDDLLDAAGQEGSFEAADVESDGPKLAIKALSTDSDEEGSASDGQQTTDFEDEKTGMMIRRTATVRLSSKDYDSASQNLTEIIKKYAVVTLYDNSYNGDYGSSSHRERNVSFRVKSEQFDELCDNMEGTDSWKVTSMDKSSDDVTKQYSDTEQRIEALQTRYDWYKKQVESVTDADLARTYSEAMFDTLDEITRLQNNNKSLETDVNYSIVTVELEEESTLSDKVDDPNDVWGDLGEAVTVLPQNIANAIGGFLLVIVTILPGLLILAVIGLVVFLIAKAIRKHNAKHPKPARPRPVSQPYYQPYGQPVPPAQPPVRPVVASPSTPAPAPVPTPAATPTKVPETDVFEDIPSEEKTNEKQADEPMGMSEDDVTGKLDETLDGVSEAVSDEDDAATEI